MAAVSMNKELFEKMGSFIKDEIKEVKISKRLKIEQKSVNNAIYRVKVKLKGIDK